MMVVRDSATSTRPTRRDVLRCAVAGLGCLGLGGMAAPGASATSAKPENRDRLSDFLIGYSEMRTNLKGGRNANVSTMRACVVRADGMGRRVLAVQLTRKPDTSTQFAGWSPDGRQAILNSGYNSPENAAWEEKNKTFRLTEGWLIDSWLLDLDSGRLVNLTAVERVSNYNSGLFFWPGNPKKLGFQAVIEGNSHPFQMDLDGRNKRDLTMASREFAYGFSASPDGKRIAYHKSYQVYVADADGSHATAIKTGNGFNFLPQWSPDGTQVMFLSGAHYDCHPYVVKRDGTGLRKLADRNGYRGVVEFLDVPDFHGGSSDVPVWSPDGSWIYYTAKVGQSIELMRGSLAGQTERLTTSKPGTLHYHTQISPNGAWLVCGSNRTGIRQLYVMTAGGKNAKPITSVGPGHGAMWAHWQPVGARK
jgi:TolB protein